MKKLQQGFSIITAIFLLVVLSFLGIAMVSFSTSQHQSSAMDVMGSRAYQAARVGIEWGAYQVLPNSAAQFATACRLGPTSSPLPAPAGSTLSGFNIQVYCQSASYVDGGPPIWIYDVSAVAATGGAPGDANYVERVISVKMGK